MYVVIAGNPVDGFTLYGGFETPDDARDWAETDDYGSEWWVAEVKPVEDEPVIPTDISPKHEGDW